MTLITRINVNIPDDDIEKIIRCLEVFQRHKFTKNLSLGRSRDGQKYELTATHETNGISREEMFSDEENGLICKDLDNAVWNFK